MNGTPLELSASVGRGGANEAADVSALKTYLIALGYDWLTPDDRADGDLSTVIDLLQSVRNGRRSVSGDGVVDVPGPTYDWLRAVDVARWRRMEPGGGAGQGFVNIEVGDPDDDHDFGTSWMAEAIAGAGRSYHDGHLVRHTDDAPLTINDVSRPRGGDTPDHSGHETGLDCDVRLPRRDGTAPGATRHTSAEYDREAMRAMLKAVRHQPRVHRILFNDPDLIREHLCVRASGHDDHAHFELAPLPPLVGYDDGYASLVDRTITTFGGAIVDPDTFPVTQDGFQEYLDGIGVRHFSAREMTKPHDEAVARNVGYELFLPPHAWWPRGASLALIADELRRLVDEPVVMRNWWRPVAYNARVDGAADSDHVTAHGVDLDYRSADSRREAEARLRELSEAEAWLQLSLGFGNLTTHVGVLSPGRKREWTYPSYVP